MAAVGLVPDCTLLQLVCGTGRQTYAAPARPYQDQDQEQEQLLRGIFPPRLPHSCIPSAYAPSHPIHPLLVLSIAQAFASKHQPVVAVAGCWQS